MSGLDRHKYCIPHICHFFYTGRIFENQILHPKKRQKTPKTLKMSLKSQIYAVFHSIWKKFTPDRIFFTQAPPVVPVTNMRYVNSCRLGDLLRYPETSVLWCHTVTFDARRFVNMS